MRARHTVAVNRAIACARAAGGDESRPARPSPIRIGVEIEERFRRVAHPSVDLCGSGHSGHAKEPTEQEIAPEEREKLLHHSLRAPGPEEPRLLSPGEQLSERPAVLLAGR